MSVTLNIVEVGARGDGVADEGRRRYFVPFSLPGEIVEAEPGEKRGEGIVADLVEVVAPSRHRETPPCAHFTICGGCSLQHWRLDVYTAWKVALIERALTQRGVPMPAFEKPLAGTPGERRRVDYVLRRQGKRVLAGFHERGSAKVVDVGNCVIARPTLVALLPPLRTALADILPDGASADAVANETDSGIDLLIRPHKRLELTVDRRQALVELAETTGLARLSWGGRGTAEPIVTRREPMLLLGEATVAVPPASFLQATKRAEQTMRAGVKAWLGDAARLADLFAGVGALTLGWPGKLALYEGDAAAVAAADAAARKRGDNKVVAERRDLFRNPLLAAELNAFDAVVLDPPRAGAVAQVAELAQSRVKKIVYASCDPGSFARDARVLHDGGYRLEKLMPIDQFLWSSHVELIALFTRR
ncbi:MAG: class I SAM-dependent RNA methyltransferase [Proteobacteria bacterium]|nr:class I SAM-dependent RNA methyltransferase [Pseudomonadota bacterium]